MNAVVVALLGIMAGIAVTVGVLWLLGLGRRKRHAADVQDDGGYEW